MPRLTIKNKLVIVMLVQLAATSACSKHINQAEIPGTYEAHHQNGVETLQLHSDGFYVHEFKATNGATSSDSSRWKFEPFKGEPKVALYDFTPHFSVSSKRADILLLDAEKDWSRVRLYLSYDLNQYYIKRDSK